MSPGSRSRPRSSLPSGAASTRRLPSRSTATPGAAGSRPWAGGSSSASAQQTAPPCGIAKGDRVEAELQLDTAPRVVAEPPDLAEALNRYPQARAAFDRLTYGLKRKHVQA